MIGASAERESISSAADGIWPAAAQRILRRFPLEDHAVERVAVPKGRQLLVQGGDVASIFFQLTGWTASECVSERGGRVITDFIIAGDFVGLTDGDSASCTVTALTDLVALRIERGHLNALIDYNRELRDVYINALQGMLQRTRLRHIALSAKTGLAKVSEILAELAERVESAGDPMCEYGRPRLPISQVLLACAVGLTPVAVNRIVQTLRRAGAIDWGASGVCVLDLKRLREFA